jgi:hypothetical protein
MTFSSVEAGNQQIAHLSVLLLRLFRTIPNLHLGQFSNRRNNSLRNVCDLFQCKGTLKNRLSFFNCELPIY